MPEGNEALIKLSISTGFAKVKVGFVFSVMKTLFELMLVLPD